jgi:hypothetical protein
MFKGTVINERIQAAVPSVVRGRLLEIDPDGTLIVIGDAADRKQYYCDYLWVDRAASAPLIPGCQVLFVPPQDGSDRGCVLGVVGRYVRVTEENHSTQERVRSSSETPRERVIEIAADEKLTLQCGESSIVLSGDGSVIIRGTRIVSRSKGINRIKGAAVQIN